MKKWIALVAENENGVFRGELRQAEDAVYETYTTGTDPYYVWQDTAGERDRRNAETAPEPRPPTGFVFSDKPAIVDSNGDAIVWHRESGLGVISSTSDWELIGKKWHWLAFDTSERDEWRRTAVHARAEAGRFSDAFQSAKEGRDNWKAKAERLEASLVAQENETRHLLAEGADVAKRELVSVQLKRDEWKDKAERLERELVEMSTRAQSWRNAAHMREKELETAKARIADLTLDKVCPDDLPKPAPSSPVPATKFFIGAQQWAGLSKLVEEAGEVLQVAGKLIATNGDPKHWDGTDLHERLTEELGDLFAAIRFVASHSGLDVDTRANEKLAVFQGWHDKHMSIQPKPAPSTPVQWEPDPEGAFTWAANDEQWCVAKEHGAPIIVTPDFASRKQWPRVRPVGLRRPETDGGR